MANRFASFGEGLVRFVRLEPLRTFYIIRLVLYLALAIYARTALDVEQLLELFAGILGVAVADGFATQNNRNRTVPAVVDDELGKLSVAGEVGAFGASLLRSLVPSFLPGATLAKALEAIMPYIGPLAGQAMTPELQREVTARVHQALRNAGVIRRVDMPPTPGGGL